MKSLAEEIKAGRATYINATSRGEKPLIASLEQAQVQKNVSERLTSCRNKLKKENAADVVSAESENQPAKSVSLHKIKMLDNFSR